MKKILAIILSLLVFQSEAKSLSVGWELWYPYQYRNKQQKLVGLDFDIFNAVNKSLQFKTSIVELPWKRHLQYIKTGDIDLAMGASYTEVRSKHAYFTEPYRVEKVNLFIQKGNPQNINLTSLDQLSKSRFIIGVEGGYFYGKLYEKLKTQPEFQSHINEVIDLEQNVKMLIKGHIDGFLADPITMKSFAKKYGIDDEIEPHPIEIYQTNIHFMLSKKSCDKATLLKFNQAIVNLKKNGELENIIQRSSNPNDF